MCADDHPAAKNIAEFMQNHQDLLVIGDGRPACVGSMSTAVSLEQTTLLEDLVKVCISGLYGFCILQNF